MGIRKFKVSCSSPSDYEETGQKRQNPEGTEKSSSVPQCGVKAVENSVFDVGKQSVNVENGESDIKEVDNYRLSVMFPAGMTLPKPAIPKFGFSSICGRQTEMQDAVTILPSFCGSFEDINKDLHYFGVYDGHGCSHVATRCRERLHELVKEEIESIGALSKWERAMERSFNRMDKEVIAWKSTLLKAKCKCELQTPDCDAVGSTAVIAIVTPNKIIVANCGDSRAVLCRKGKPIPLSSDHKMEDDRLPILKAEHQEEIEMLTLPEKIKVLSIPPNSSCNGVCPVSKHENCSSESELRSKSAMKLVLLVLFYLVVMSVEVVGGVKANSVAVVTDERHLLSDVA